MLPRSAAVQLMLTSNGVEAELSPFLRLAHSRCRSTSPSWKSKTAKQLFLRFPKILHGGGAAAGKTEDLQLLFPRKMRFPAWWRWRVFFFSLVAVACVFSSLMAVARVFSALLGGVFFQLGAGDGCFFQFGGGGVCARPHFLPNICFLCPENPHLDNLTQIFKRCSLLDLLLL